MASADDKLVEKIRVALKGKHAISEKKMFGGICFLQHGNMLCGVAKGKMVARIGPNAYEKALKQKHVTKMDFTGKPLKGMVYILEAGTKRQASVTKWVQKSIEFVKQLPKKVKKLN